MKNFSNLKFLILFLEILSQVPESADPAGDGSCRGTCRPAPGRPGPGSPGPPSPSTQ
jgi:hypothetical protein